MKTKYKYIHFEQDLSENGWSIYNNKSKLPLGSITYYKTWKQYVFEGDTDCVFNESCLSDIIDFIKQVNNPSEGGGE